MKNRSKTIITILFLLITFITYILTSYNTITWWNGCSYTIAAHVLGINFPPGSLLLTIIGWILTKLTFGFHSSYFLNLFSGLAATLSSLMIFRIIQTITQLKDKKPSGFDIIQSKHYIIVILLSCLFFSWNQTIWRYATHFTPYILTVLFTTFITWSMIKWWENAKTEKGYLWIFVILFLLGLDFSVHRTNLLLVPGILAWVLIRDKSTFLKLKNWLFGFLGLFSGVLFQFLTIPIASRHPVINANNPDNLQRFYDYISLKQYGGSWLTDIMTRKASFFDVQAMDYLSFLNKFLSGIEFDLNLITELMILIIIMGVIFSWKMNRLITIGLIINFIFYSLGAIIYFNISENYYWPMHRHYLPSLVFLTPFIGFGFLSMTKFALKQTKLKSFYIVTAVYILLILTTVNLFSINYSKNDNSKKYFAYDYGKNILDSILPNGIIFISGDNYYPLIFLQAVEGYRPDITIISHSLTNTNWYVKQILEQDKSFPLSLSENELENIGPRRWSDTTISIIFEGNKNRFQFLQNDIPDTLLIKVPPLLADKYLLAQDWLLVELLKMNSWKRPLYFTSVPIWLTDYAQFEGLIYQILPTKITRLSPEIIEKNLIYNYNFRGYNNPKIMLNKFTKATGRNYIKAFLQLAMFYKENEEKEKVLIVLNQLNTNFIIDRLDLPQQFTSLLQELTAYVDNKTPNF